MGAWGRQRQGSPCSREALALVDTTGRALYEAELHRLQGELVLAHAGGA